MNPAKILPRADANGEVSALIEVLHETGQPLEELTAGEAATRDGQMFMLPRFHDQLEIDAAPKQAAILNSLPAALAVLDNHGFIISMNDAWERFGRTNAIQGPGCGIGLNYLEICSAREDDSSEAYQVSAGIRSVLGGGVEGFSFEYPCHSPTEQRCFLLMVTRLADAHSNGAVVMHLDITELRRTQGAHARSEAGLAPGPAHGKARARHYRPGWVVRDVSSPASRRVMNSNEDRSL